MKFFSAILFATGVILLLIPVLHAAGHDPTSGQAMAIGAGAGMVSMGWFYKDE